MFIAHLLFNKTITRLLVRLSDFDGLVKLLYSLASLPV
jgi:hypothetical protein